MVTRTPAGPRESLRLFDLRRNWKALTARPPFHDPVVDGVRAIAILWVMSYHLVLFHLGSFTTEAIGIATGRWTQWTSRGDMGVDLFFVISGYLIGTILLREYRKSGTLQIRRFYIRRFLRLIPVYTVAMIVGLYFVHNIPREAVLMEFPPFMNANNMWANFLYVNNFLPINRQYMGWCWSLAIEEQFYLILPGFILLVMRVGKPMRILGEPDGARRHHQVDRHRPARFRAAVPRSAEHAVLGRPVHDRVPESLYALRRAALWCDRRLSDGVPSRASGTVLRAHACRGRARRGERRDHHPDRLFCDVLAALHRDSRRRAHSLLFASP